MRVFSPVIAFALGCAVALASRSLAHADASKPATCGATSACEQACTAKRDVGACVAAADRYWEGKGGHPYDPAKSFRYAKLGCDGGDGFGCALLGLHYQDGIGTEWAPKLAVTTYEKSCKAGTGVGCFNLATMYSGAHGIDFDGAKADVYEKLAKQHWEAACKGDNPRWCTNVAYLVRKAGGADAAAASHKLDQRSCDHGIQVGCVEAIDGSFRLGTIKADAYLKELERLCKAGEPSACSYAGGALYAGTKIPKDPKRGIELMKRGCEIGDRMACHLAAGEFERGEHVARDPAAVQRYLNMACDRGFGMTCIILAKVRLHASDKPGAAVFAKRGCQMGNKEGCALLTGIHEFSKNEPEAVKWGKEACRMGDLGSCGFLIERDLDLPVPADQKKRIYTIGCKEKGLKPACKRLEKL